MEKQDKKKFVEELRGRLEKAKGAFLFDYKGLNVESLNRLRRELRDAGAEFQVVKNRLLKLASENTPTEAISAHMVGPTAIAFTREDIVSPANVLVEFARSLKQARLKNGQISGKMIDSQAVERLAELPGREVLLAQTLSAMQAVPASLVRGLGALLTQLLYALSAIEKKKAAAA